MKKLKLDESLVLKLYSEGLTTRQIGEKLCCSKHPIQIILKKNNYPVTMGPRPIKQKLIKETKPPKIISDYEIVEYFKNHTLIQVRKKFGIGQRRIYKACNKLGFQKPKFRWVDLSPESKKLARDKATRTCIERYGQGSLTNSQKISQTKSDISWKLKHKDVFVESGKKISTTMNSTEYLEKTREVRKLAGKKISKTLLSRSNQEKQQFRDRYTKTCMAKYGVSNTWALAKSVNHSSGEEEVKKFISSLGFEVFTDKKLISPYELDIYIPEKNFAIEYNGTFWHDSEHKDKLYHYRKTNLCKQKGVRLFHIYEWEWRSPVKQEIIKSVLRILLNKTESRIYARNCEIKKVNQKDYREFCINNHLQGYRSASLVYGLYYQGELKQLMSFNKPQERGAKKNYQWEIVRGCPGSNNIVVGGVSKLWKHFIRENNPDSVMSYCDANKFDGGSYLEIGMHLVSVQKSNTWYIDKESGKITQWLYRNKDKREAQLKNSYKVYGAGNLLFAWENPAINIK